MSSLPTKPPAKPGVKYYDTLAFKPPLWNRLNAYCKRHDKVRARVVRRAIEELLNREDKP